MLVALYAVIGRDPVAAVVLTPVALAPMLVRRPVSLGLPAQAVVSFAVLGLGALLSRVLPGPGVAFRGVMGPLVPFVAMASILIAGSRLFLRAPAGGDRATVAQGFWCLVVCGAHRSGVVYVAGCTLYLLVSAAWLRGGRSWARGRHTRWWALGMVLAAGLAGGLAWTVPQAHLRVVRWLAGTTVQTGLPEGPLELGSLAGMAQSDRVVARVFGAHDVMLLRGIVYQEYVRGRWFQRVNAPPQLTPIEGAGGPMEIRYESTDTPRFLLPLGARDLVLNAPSAMVDIDGVLTPAASTRLDFARLSEGPREQLAPVASQPGDRALPPSLRAELAPLARRWVGDATDPAEQIARLARELTSHHRYSLTFERPPRRRDPVAAFLAEEGSAGHCEYFASAMAVLARTIGVPARVVGGYRVSEYNPVGHYHVVRERNAHAWVEVELPGKGWVSVDATPADSLAMAGPEQTPPLSAVLDALLTKASDWLQRALDRPALVALALVPVLVWLLGREAWQRWRGRRRAGVGFIDAPFDPPPPHMVALLQRLAARGIAHPATASLESLARRLDGSDDEAAALLRRYADLRYGGIGDDERLREDVARYLQAPIVSAATTR